MEEIIQGQNSVWKYRFVIEKAYNVYRDIEADIHPKIKEVISKRSFYNASSTDPLMEVYDEILPKVVEKIQEAIANNKTIIISADYDTDGQTACAILYTGLKQLTNKVFWVMPNRQDTGYGLHRRLIEDICFDNNVPFKDVLIITVDNGVNERQTIEELKQLGMEVVVTDHHLLDDGAIQPDCLCYDPKLYQDISLDDTWGSGAYLAAKLALQLVKDRLTPEYKEYCYALVAMSIISDIIPLYPNMRQICKMGFSILRTLAHDGIKSLFSVCKVNNSQPIDERTLGYSVVPKLNSSGRMSDGKLSVDLLLHFHDKYKVKRESMFLAETLLQLNTNRKELEQVMFDKALLVCDDAILAKKKGLVVYDPHWEVGVLGIVAARLVEKFNLPTIVLSKNRNHIEGSGRAPKGFPLFECLKLCKDHLLRFGGHDAACGCSLREQDFLQFKQAFEKYAGEIKYDSTIINKIDADVNIVDMLNLQFQSQLSIMAPYGSENDPLIFRLSGVKVAWTNLKPNGTVYMLVTDQNDYAIQVHKYKAPERYNQLEGYVLDLLLTSTLTYFYGTTTVEWSIVDLRIYGE